MGKDLLEKILPAIAAGKNVVISAHGNSLRSLLVILREHKLARVLSDKEIEKLEVQLSVPIAINFNNKLEHEEMWSNQHSPKEVLAFLQAGSPLVEDRELAKGLSGKLNKDGKDGVNLFDLIENAFEGKENEPGRAGHQRVVKLKTDIVIAGVICKTWEVSRFQQSIKGNDVKYRTIEFFADEGSNEYVLQIKVYNDGRVDALSRGR